MKFTHAQYGGPRILAMKVGRLLATKTNSDVEMTDNCKSTKVRMVNEWQVRTFIINDKKCEVQSCVRACNLRTLVNIMHVYQSYLNKREKTEGEQFIGPVKIFMKAQKKRKNRKKRKTFVKSHFSLM